MLTKMKTSSKSGFTNTVSLHGRGETGCSGGRQA
jgi:hypothetical protein